MASEKCIQAKQSIPSEGKKRHSWLKQFPYSEARNGVQCILFAKRTVPLGQLVTSAMTNFTRATVTLERQATHKTATKMCS